MQRPLLRRTLTLRFIALLPLALVTGTSSETLQRARHVRFTTHEGSWLSFDVSRDARWIVMDLLGQLWLLPAAGGVARSEERRVGKECRCRWSADEINNKYECTK